MTSLLNSPLGAPAAPKDGALGNSFPRLLVHTRADKLALAAPICASEGLGAVVVVKPGAPHGALRALIHEYSREGIRADGLIFDADTYSGKKRLIGTDGMASAWVRAQSNAGVPHPLTNPGFIPETDHASLRAVLRASSSMGPHVIAALPVANRFLKQDVDVLIEEINASEVGAVGLMIEHSKDPFGSRATVRGLVRLLAEANVPVLLLRCDLSLIGALAWGARGGAFGTSTGLRHIYPIVKGGGGRPASVSALVRDTMSMNRLDKIGDAIQLWPDRMWNCPCSVCYGRSLSWVATEDEAFRHSLAVVAHLAAEVLDESLSPLQRRQLWRSLCQTAQFRALEIDAETKGSGWKAADFLGAWVAQEIDTHAPV